MRTHRAACCRPCSSASSRSRSSRRSKRRTRTRSPYALIPGRPSFPRTGPWMAAAMAFGIVLGLLLVYVRELTDSTFRSGEDVRTVLGLPCLALIPRISAPRAQRHAASRTMPRASRARRSPSNFAPCAPDFIMAGPSAHHRDHRGARRRKARRRSPGHSARLAAMNGEHVVVVDCDFRHPSFGETPPSGPGGLSAGAGRACRGHPQGQGDRHGLDRRRNGETNALGLLMSAAMAQLLQTLAAGLRSCAARHAAGRGDHRRAHRRRPGRSHAVLHTLAPHVAQRRAACPGTAWRRRTPTWSAQP